MKTYNKVLTPYLLIIPSFIILTLFFFIPFIETFILSFKSYQNIYSPDWVGVANYIKLFNSPIFWKTLFNTFLYVFIVVPALIVLPLIIAIVVNQKIKGSNLFKLIIYLPVVVSLVVAGIAWKWIYANSGILNYLISLVQLPAVGWLTDPNIAIFSVMIVTVWKGLGYYMLIYLAALTTIPKDLYEAADIDGASSLNKHLLITIPHLKPTIALVSIISSISGMKIFVEIYVMTKGGPLNSSKTIVYYIYQRAFENLDLGFASAAGVVLLVITLIFSILNIKFLEYKKFEKI